MVIGIIGGGASGMAAALAAGENPGAQVLLFERQARLGRKLQATGNGRCNLTNLHACCEGYHGSDVEFARPVLEMFPPQAVLDWFHRLGLFTVAEKSGRVYPYSDQANSVLDVLRFALDKENIQVIIGFEVSRIRHIGQGFLIEGQDACYNCDKVIVACGGLAGTKLGGSMWGYKLLGKLGHRTTKLRPALVQLKTRWGGSAALKGIRANCSAQILHNGHVYSQSNGEIQFTEYGISGPVVFEISRDVCNAPGDWLCRLDMLPHVEEETLMRELRRRRNTSLHAEELLTGILHNRLGRMLTKEVGISPNKPIAELSDGELLQVCQVVKCFQLPIAEPMGMENAQVTAGGVETLGFDPSTMESKLLPGLYACGEVLDIDGDCGGYNLQWAWSSGRIAGCHAGKDVK